MEKETCKERNRKRKGAGGRRPQETVASPQQSGTGTQGIFPTLRSCISATRQAHTRSSQALLGAQHLLSAAGGRDTSKGLLGAKNLQISSLPSSCLSLRFLWRFADFLFLGSPAPCSQSDKLIMFSLRALCGFLSQPSWFKGHQATPPMKLSISFGSIKFSINLVSGQYRFSL